MKLTFLNIFLIFTTLINIIMQSKELHTVPKVVATSPCGNVDKPSTEGTLYINDMGKRIDVKKGDRYGRWIIIKEVEKKYNARQFLCKCDCGVIKKNLLGSMRTADNPSTSCGCYKNEIFIERNTRHNLARHPLYSVHLVMIQRCYNKINKSYFNYGGRGITICDEWKNDFMAFYNWAMANGYKKGLSIERKDNNANYEPDNCKWATQKEQSRNKRTNVIITYKGETKILADWAKSLGLSYMCLSKRLRKWPIERAFTEKIHLECVRKPKVKSCF